MSRTAQAVKEAATALNSTPTLTLVKGQPRALSTDVAAYFGKRHKDVLRQIDNISANCPESFTERNFAPSEYTDATGRKLPAYSMTRDGFTMLAMGFTGPKAIQFKIAYIEAFSAMEAELAARARDGFMLTGGDAPVLDGPSCVKTRKPLGNLINTWVGLAPITYRDAWHQVKGHFLVEKAENLTLAQVKEACEWVQERIDRLGLAHGAEKAKAAPPAPNPLLALPEGQAIKLPDLERIKADGREVVKAASVFQDIANPFFYTHLEFTKSLREACKDNPAIWTAHDCLYMFGIYAETLAGVASNAHNLVTHVIAGYELVAAIQKGRPE
jgi:Rha family phage regulatory protein